MNTIQAMEQQDPDTPEQKDEEPQNALLSEQFDDLKESLEVLYILANISGRLQFVKNWPDLASRIFGDELIAFDTDGTQELEKRAALEQEAEERRIQMLERLDGVEEKSVQEGVLQTEFVEGLIKDLGRDIALLVYAEKIVDRFIPPPAPVVAPTETVEQPSVEPPQAAPVAPAPVEAPPAAPVAPSMSTSPVTVSQVAQEPPKPIDFEAPPVEASQSPAPPPAQESQTPPVVESQKFTAPPEEAPADDKKPPMTFMPAKTADNPEDSGS